MSKVQHQAKPKPVVVGSQPSSEATCPSCGSRAIQICFEARDLPAHSCLLMATREEAVRYPRGDLQLGFCRKCGFLSNLRFDAELSAYSPEYEETQHFSPRFCQFAYELAQRLIRRYRIRGKSVLEIGCGKGEFLDLMCRLGNNEGLGIDPSCRPERLGDQAASRLTFVRDYYSEAYSHLHADVILCRHTLEHIPSTRRFMEMVRSAAGERHETLVIFELPDTTRVLREAAFWDIYYEHCSYFTAGSLARLFRNCRFEILDLWRDFGDQYLIVVAKPSRSQTRPTLAIEDDLEQTARDVDAFQAACPAHIDHWRKTIRELATSGRRPVVWGSGSKCVAFFSALGAAPPIDVVVDINPFRHGRYIPGTGHEIQSPEFLARYQPGAVVVMNAIYCEEIARKLGQLGVRARLYPV